MAAIGLLLVFHLMMLIYAGQLFPMGDFAPVWAVMLRRMLCGGIGAGVGCLIALMTETTSATHLEPLCLCYAMVVKSSSAPDETCTPCARIRAST
ncbi:MAG: hypothetical protein E7318_03035 [Clostridiales bacterium]|nr:hypothetical protein [Clostridiales bacterium]